MPLATKERARLLMSQSVRCPAPRPDLGFVAHDPERSMTTNENELDIDLGDDLKRFIHREVVEGRFSSAIEVIEAGLQVLQERETRRSALRSLIEQSEHAAVTAHGGVDSGRGPRRQP
jgi:putative addiction module CopG family antidote